MQVVFHTRALVMKSVRFSMMGVFRVTLTTALSEVLAGYQW